MVSNSGAFNISDVAVIVIILLFALWGMKKGFVKSVLGLVSIVISIVLALVLYQPVATFLKSSVIGQYVTVNIVKTLEGADNTGQPAENSGAGSILNLPPEIFEKLTQGIDTAKSNAVATISESVANLAINLISMLVVFLIVKLILWLVTIILDVLTKLPVVKSLNKLMGGVWGALSGLITVYLLLALLTFVTAVNTDNAVVNNVLESEIASKMYNENFIVNIITPKEAHEA